MVSGEGLSVSIGNPGRTEESSATCVQNKVSIRSDKSRSALGMLLENLLNDSHLDEGDNQELSGNNSDPLPVPMAVDPAPVITERRQARVIRDEDSQEDEHVPLSTASGHVSVCAVEPELMTVEDSAAIADIDYPPTDVDSDGDSDTGAGAGAGIKLAPNFPDEQSPVRPGAEAVGEQCTLSAVVDAAPSVSVSAAVSVSLSAADIGEVARLAALAPVAEPEFVAPEVDAGEEDKDQIAKVRKAISHVTDITEIVTCMSSINSVLRGRVRNCSTYMDQLNSSIGNKLTSRLGARTLDRKARIGLRNDLVEKEWEYKQFRLLVETNTIDVFEAFRKHKASLVSKLRRQPNSELDVSRLSKSLRKLEFEHDGLREEWRSEDLKVVKHIDRIFRETDSVLKDDSIFDSGESDDDGLFEDTPASANATNEQVRVRQSKAMPDLSPVRVVSHPKNSVYPKAPPSRPVRGPRTGDVPFGALRDAITKTKQTGSKPPVIQLNANKRVEVVDLVSDCAADRSGRARGVSPKSAPRRRYVPNPLMLRTGNINSVDTRRVSSVTLPGVSAEHTAVPVDGLHDAGGPRAVGADVPCISSTSANSGSNATALCNTVTSAPANPNSGIIPTSVLSAPTGIANRFDSFAPTPVNLPRFGAPSSTAQTDRADLDAFIVDSMVIDEDDAEDLSDDEAVASHADGGGADGFVDVCLQGDGRLALLFSAYEIKLDIGSFHSDSEMVACPTVLSETGANSRDLFDGNCTMAARLFERAVPCTGSSAQAALESACIHLNSSWEVMTRTTVRTAVLLPTGSDVSAMGENDLAAHFNNIQIGEESKSPASPGPNSSPYGQLGATVSPSAKFVTVMEVYLQRLTVFLNNSMGKLLRSSNDHGRNRSPLVAYYRAGFCSLLGFYKQFWSRESASVGANRLNSVHLSRKFWTVLASSCGTTSTGFSGCSHLQQYKTSVVLVEFMAVQCHTLIEWWWTATHPTSSTFCVGRVAQDVVGFLLTTWVSLVDVLLTQLRHEGSPHMATSTFFASYLVQHLGTLDYAPVAVGPDGAQRCKASLDVSLYGLSQQFFNLWYTLTEFFGNSSAAAAGWERCGLAGGGGGSVETTWGFVETFVRRCHMRATESEAVGTAYWRILLVHSRVLICLKRKAMASGQQRAEIPVVRFPALPPGVRYSPYSCGSGGLSRHEKVVSYNIAPHWPLVEFLVQEEMNLLVVKYLKARSPLVQRLKSDVKELRRRAKAVSTKESEVATAAGGDAAGHRAPPRPHQGKQVAKVQVDELGALRASLQAKQTEVTIVSDELSCLLVSLHEGLVRVIYRVTGMIVQLVQSASWGVQEGSSTAVVQMVLNIAMHLIAIGLKRPAILDSAAGCKDVEEVVAPGFGGGPAQGEKAFYERVEAIVDLVGKGSEHVCFGTSQDASKQPNQNTQSFGAGESVEAVLSRAEETLSKCISALVGFNCTNTDTSSSTRARQRGSFLPVAMSAKRYAAVKRYVCGAGLSSAPSEEGDTRDAEFVRITQKAPNAFSGNIVLSALVAMFKICTEVTVEINQELGTRKRAVDQMTKYFKRDSDTRGFTGMLHQLKATVTAEHAATEAPSRHKIATVSVSTAIPVDSFQSSAVFMCYLYVIHTASALQNTLGNDGMFHTKVQKLPSGESSERAGWVCADSSAHKILYGIEDHFWKLLGPFSGTIRGARANTDKRDELTALLNHESGAGSFSVSGKSDTARPSNVVGDIWLPLRLLMIHHLLHPIEVFGVPKPHFNSVMVLAELDSLHGCVSDGGKAAHGAMSPFVTMVDCCISLLAMHQWAANDVVSGTAAGRMKYLEHVSSVLVVEGADVGAGRKGFVKRICGDQGRQSRAKVVGVVSGVLVLLMRFVIHEYHKFALQRRMAGLRFREKQLMQLMMGIDDDEAQSGATTIAQSANDAALCSAVNVCTGFLVEAAEECRVLLRQISSKVNFSGLVMGGTCKRSVESTGSSMTKQFVASATGLDAESSWKVVVDILKMLGHYSSCLFVMLPLCSELLSTNSGSAGNLSAKLPLLCELVYKSVRASMVMISGAHKLNSCDNPSPPTSIISTATNNSTKYDLRAAFDLYLHHIRATNQAANFHNFNVFGEVLKCLFYQPLLKTCVDVDSLMISLTVTENVGSALPYYDRSTEKWMLTFLMSQSSAILKALFTCSLLPCCISTPLVGLENSKSFIKRVAGDVRFPHFETLVTKVLSVIKSMPALTPSVSILGSCFEEEREFCGFLFCSYQKVEQDSRGGSHFVRFAAWLACLVRSLESMTLKDATKSSTVSYVTGAISALRSICHAAANSGNENFVKLIHDIRAAISVVLIPALCAHKGDTWKNFASDYFGQSQKNRNYGGIRKIAEWGPYMEEMELFFSNCIQRKSGHVNVLASSLGLSDSLNYGLKNLPLYIHGLAFTRFGLNFEQFSKWFDLLRSCWAVEMSGRVLDCWVLGICRDYICALDVSGQERLRNFDPALGKRLDEYREVTRHICGTTHSTSDIDKRAATDFRRFVLGSQDMDKNVWDERPGGVPLSTLRSVFSLKCCLLGFSSADLSPDEVTLDNGICSGDRADLLVISAFAATLLAIQCVSVLVNPDQVQQLCGLRLTSTTIDDTLKSWLGLIRSSCSVHNEVLVSLGHAPPASRAGHFAHCLRLHRKALHPILVAIELAAKDYKSVPAGLQALQVEPWRAPFPCQSAGSTMACRCVRCHIDPLVREVELRVKNQFVPLCEGRIGAPIAPRGTTRSAPIQALSKLLVEACT